MGSVEYPPHPNHEIEIRARHRVHGSLGRVVPQWASSTRSDPRPDRWPDSPALGNRQASHLMVDLHCHILPGIDDGAADLEDSVGMARQAEADGIELVCATPHIRHDHDVRIHELAGRVEALRSELDRHGLRVRLEAGGEVAETALDGLAADELRAVSLCGTGRWVLLEPAPGPLSRSLEEAVERLRERGARAVIAHPERHPAEDLTERLARMVRVGALVQVTAALLGDPDAGPALIRLAELGLVHLVASDSHSSRAGRPVALSEALARLASVPIVAPHLDWVAREAPAAIVRGEEVEPPFEPIA